MATTTKTFTATGSWICPPGVTSIQVAAQGGGGAGGARTTTGGGGGGGGGEYAKETAVNVTTGTTYTVTVGAAGTNNGSTVVQGGSSSFVGDNVTVTAHGGTTVANNTLTGGAGGTGSANTTHHNGGAGFTSAGTTGGGGGSAASDTTVGVTATSATGAASPSGAANNFGGAGGTGSTTGNTGGAAPTNPAGGGGGGADRSSTGTQAGGSGQAGQIILTYTTPLIEKLTDNFSSGSIRAALWTNQFGTISVVSQQLNLTAPLNSTAYAGMDSLENYDLTASYMFVQIINPGNTALASYEIYPLQLFNVSSANALKWHVFNNVGTATIEALKIVASSQTALAQATFVAATYQWLRIRESGGTTFFDYSSDGFSWTNFASVSNPIALTSLFLEPSAGSFVAEAATTGILDNFNLAPPIGRDITDLENTAGANPYQAVNRSASF